MIRDIAAANTTRESRAFTAAERFAAQDSGLRASTRIVAIERDQKLVV